MHESNKAHTHTWIKWHRRSSSPKLILFQFCHGKMPLRPVKSDSIGIVKMSSPNEMRVKYERTEMSEGSQRCNDTHTQSASSLTTTRYRRIIESERVSKLHDKSISNTQKLLPNAHTKPNWSEFKPRCNLQTLQTSNKDPHMQRRVERKMQHKLSVYGV